MLDLEELERLLPYVDGPRWEDARKAYWDAAPTLLALVRAGRRLAEAGHAWLTSPPGSGYEVVCRVPMLEALAAFREADGG